MVVRVFARALALAVLLGAGSGCGSFWSIGDSDGTLEDSVRTYTKLVRWGELERASLFVDESVREEFLALAPRLERLRFTDYDLGPVDQGGPENEARVTVVYRFYDVATLVEHQVEERQVWSSSGRRQWSVQPDLSGFRRAVGAPSDAVGALRPEPSG